MIDFQDLRGIIAKQSYHLGCGGTLLRAIVKSQNIEELKQVVKRASFPGSELVVEIVNQYVPTKTCKTRLCRIETYDVHLYCTVRKTYRHVHAESAEHAINIAMNRMDYQTEPDEESALNESNAVSVIVDISDDPERSRTTKWKFDRATGKPIPSNENGDSDAD